jgi:hypothetical protein
MERDSSTPGSRRDQDIALDLLKFVASTTGVIRPATASTGFTAPASAKPEDQVSQLLELYARCLNAVQVPESKVADPPSKAGGR